MCVKIGLIDNVSNNYTNDKFVVVVVVVVIILQILTERSPLYFSNLYISSCIPSA